MKPYIVLLVLASCAPQASYYFVQGGGATNVTSTGWSANATSTNTSLEVLISNYAGGPVLKTDTLVFGSSDPIVVFKNFGIDMFTFDSDGDLCSGSPAACFLKASGSPTIVGTWTFTTPTTFQSELLIKTKSAPSAPVAGYSHLYGYNDSGQISPMWQLTNGTTYNILTSADPSTFTVKEGVFVAVNVSRYNSTLNWTNSFTTLFTNNVETYMSNGCVNTTLKRHVVDYRCNLQNTQTTSTTNTYMTVSLYQTNSTSTTWTIINPSRTLIIGVPSSSNDYKSVSGRSFYYDVGTIPSSNWTCYRLYGQHSAAGFTYNTMANECTISVREVK